MLCSKCGAEHPTDARFCGKCGAALSGPPVTPANPSGNPAAASPPRKKWTLTLTLTFGAIACLGVLGGLFMVGSRMSSTSYPPIQQDASSSNNDNYYRNKVVGNWQVRKFVMGSYADVRCVYLPNGRVNWTGTLTYMGQQTFLMYGGIWQVENGILHTRIESSNVPLLLPVGTTGASRFVSIDDRQWTFVDLSDGQTGTAIRVATY